MGHPDRPGRGLGVLTLLIAICQVGLFPGAIFFGETFVRRDLESYYRPAKSLLSPLARASGGLPLWNPYFASGQPFAANPEHELFHPLTALFFVLPFELAFRLQIILPLLIAALSMYFLLVTLGAGIEAALLGGISWGIGGYALSTTNLLPILFAIAVLPAVLAFTVRIVTRGGPGNVAGLALSLGLECLAGEPSTLLMTIPLLLAVLGHVAAEPDGFGRLRRRATALAAALALGAALGAVTLLPGLHHASKTVRAEGVPDSLADLWSLPPIRVVELVFPRVMGQVDRPDDDRYWGGTLYPVRDYPFLLSIYPGLLVTLLAGVAIVRRRGPCWIWLGTAILGVLLAVGTHLPLWSWLRGMSPFLRGLRYPEKFILLTVFAVTVLGSLGLETLLRRAPGQRRGLYASLAVVGLLATVAGLSFLTADALEAGALARRIGIPPRIAGSWVDLAARDLFMTGAVAALGLLSIRSAHRIGWLLVATTAAELVLLGRPLVTCRPVSQVMTPPPFLEPLVRSRNPSLLFHYAAYHPKLSVASGLRSPPIPSQWGIATTLEADFDLTELRWSARATDRFLEVIHKDPLLFPALLRRRGVTAVLRFRPGLDAEMGERLPVGPEGPLQLFLTRDPNPFAFCASRVVVADGEEGWMEAVRRLGPEAATTAVVSRDELDPAPAEVSPGSVRMREYRPQRLLLEVNAHGPHSSFVAVNQTWDDGWNLRVDGAPARLLRTDISLSGFVLAPGPHRVELTYVSRWLTVGLVISTASLVVIAVLLLLGRRSSGPSLPR